jgi:predicted AAA+ superfamily ATPase
VADLNRLIKKSVIESLEAFPAVFIAGPRQSGKTTLVQEISRLAHPAQYLTFDDLQTRSSAQYDPMAFLRSFKGAVVLDEIQMVPELFRPLKIIIDENRQQKSENHGQFLLTGSASITALPALSDALMGRMVLHTLYPFSALEIQKNPEQSFIDRAFSDDWHYMKIDHQDMLEIITQASFPELMKLKTQSLRDKWCGSYIDTILQRDVRVLMEIEKLDVIPDLLRLIAARTGGLLNETALSRDIELNHITTKKYRTLLEGLFLIHSVPAWSNNLGKRLIKSPKQYLADINLLLYLINTTLPELAQNNKKLFGQVLENYVCIELYKQLTFSDIHAELYHYRAASGQQEIDFILEGPQQQIVGIEVKAKSKVTAQDFQHLASLQSELGKTFKQGFVLYLGNEVIPFGENLWAVPLSCLN